MTIINIIPISEIYDQYLINKNIDIIMISAVLIEL
jgi:hypothetical protein